MSFARTKIQAPRLRAALVDRGPLQARLLQALQQQRLVLLCAPAGFGKTALLARTAAAAPGLALAWVSADAGDDLQRLLECMLAALEPFDPPWRSAPESILKGLASGEPEARRAKLAELINALDLCDQVHGLIVFDDLHRVADPAFFAFLDELLERLSSKWTLALSSRSEPPLALARWRAAGELAEFRQPQLRFAQAEARALLGATALAPELEARLLARTQGWPAGLRMALGVLQGVGPGSAERLLRASERSWFDFLLTEVLQQLPPALADFLQAVSVLPELQAPRCAALTGDACAADRLAEVEHLGLFVELLEDAAGGRSLRLHDLFREALQLRLRREQPERWQALRELAARTEPDPLRRLQLRLEDGAVAEAAALAFEHLPGSIVTAGAPTALHLIEQFPPAAREQRPELAFVRGLAGWAQRWDFPLLRQQMERAAAGFAGQGQGEAAELAQAYEATALIAMGRPDEGRARLAGLQAQAPACQVIVQNAEVWAAIEDCRFDAVAPLLARMLDSLQRADRIELWYQSTPPLRLPGLPGITALLERHAELMLAVAGEAPTPLRTIALQTQAWCALWRGQLDEAARQIERSLDDAHWSGRSGAVRAHQLCLAAALALAQGDGAAAVAAATQRQQEFGASASAWHRYLLALYRARIAASAGDAGTLAEALQQAQALRPLDLPGGEPVRRARELPLEAVLADLQGDAAHAPALLQACLTQEAAVDVLGFAAELRLRLARLQRRAGQAEAAAQSLRPLFERARRDGPGGALLASALLHELAALDWQGLLTDAEQAALRAWAARVGAQPPAPTPTPANPTLSARELEVLARIAAGDSNKLIARRFELSPHTVKRHVANILHKIAVDSRGQAAAWFREHGH
ncbi:LuxR C-terminal-related transcriptional regulator [Inhella sp.]|uniref:LuxR C-terminal-related transcriptional regulator n=1 Tax=Inhella sp. TaxID=1921806 RepID=UPI0035B1AA0A